MHGVMSIVSVVAIGMEVYVGRLVEDLCIIGLVVLLTDNIF